MQRFPTFTVLLLVATTLLAPAWVAGATAAKIGFTFATGFDFEHQIFAPVSVTVNRSVNVASTVTVQYATSDGTGVAPTNYLSASGTLTFAPDETSKNIDISAVNDNLANGDKTFKLTLSNPGPGAELGTVSETVITLKDAGVPAVVPAVLELGAATVEVAESAGSVALNVLRQGNTTLVADVQYATSNVSAVAGTNYTATSDTLSFLAGEITKTISIPIINDNAANGDKVFKLSLSNPSSGSSLGVAETQVTIKEVSPTPSSAAPATPPAANGGGGGGCAISPIARPDSSWIVLLLGAAALRPRKR